MYAIRNKATGQQYRPASRGYTNYLYATRYDAEQAVHAMPPRWRTMYEPVEVSFRVVVGDDTENTGLDSARFPTRREAEAALATLDGRRSRRDSTYPEIVMEFAPPTTAFDEWNVAA